MKLTAKLGEIAPAKPLKRPNIDTKTDVWHLNLDQIESNSGQILKEIIAPIADAKNSTHWFDERHVLYSKLRPYLNKVVVPDKYGVATTELVPMMPDPERLKREYLAYYLKSDRFVHWVNVQVAGAKMPRVSMKVFWNHRIPLPPLPVQQKIATILDTADALKQKDKALIAKYDELCQSLFLDMFDDPVTNPKEFSKMKLSDFCEFENGDRSSNYPGKGETTKHGKLFLSSGDIIGGKFIVKASKFISEEKFNSLTRGKCHKGDVLMTLRGNGLGRSGVFDCEFHEGFINAQMVILRPNSKCLNNYLVFQLNCPPVFKRLLKISSGSAQPQLTAGNVKLFEVLVPSIDLQKQFAERIQTIEKQKQQAQASLEKSEDLFNCLLQKAFKGELVS